MTSPVGLAIAGPLADRVFEPAMASGGTLASLCGGLFGTKPGSGMALLYTLFALCGAVIALAEYAFPVLRKVGEIVPDHER